MSWTLAVGLLAPVEPGTASLTLCFFDAWLRFSTWSALSGKKGRHYIRRKLTGPSSAPARRLRLTVMISGGSDMVPISRSVL